MTVRPIRILGDPVLRTPAEPVVSFDKELKKLVRDLLDTVVEPGRAGVAAPQIGVGVRAFAYCVDDETGYVINPVLQVGDGVEEDDEGCLSVPQLWYPLNRASWAAVIGVDRRGAPIRVEGTGQLARALQHECDHLDGTLYVDRLTGKARKRWLRALREAG